MISNPNYHDQVAEGKKWLMKHVPYYSRWYRFLLFWMAGDSLLPSIEIDKNWPHPDRSVSAANDMMREAFAAATSAQLAHRPDIAEKVIPTYPPFGKRMLQDNGHYLKALTRDNVELVTGSIPEIVADGIVDASGRHHPLDVIIYATGFQATKFLWPMKVTGRRGKVLSEIWGDTPRAHLGITIPEFPNLFCLYGPGTNLAHAGSIVFHSECQVRYIMGCLKMLIESGHRAIEVKASVHDDYVDRLEKRLAGLVWSHPGVTSWYRNERGVVVNTSPWRLLDYWNWTRKPESAEYELN
jgi:4-hydroxyacetophenone monooxygenase